MAFEIELGGRAFYQPRRAPDARPGRCGSCSASSRRWRASTWQTLSRRYHADVPAPSAEFQLDRAAIYAGLENRPEDPVNLFRIAIAFEERAVDSSPSAARRRRRSAERQLYNELAAEEREHVALLTTEFEQFQAGKPGLL